MAQVQLDDSGDPQNDAGIILTRLELEKWAGRPLTGQDITRLAAVIGSSSVPQAIEAITSSWRTSRVFTLHVDTVDPDFSKKLLKVLQDAESLHDRDNDMELREADGSETGRYLAGWES